MFDELVTSSVSSESQFTSPKVHIISSMDEGVLRDTAEGYKSSNFTCVVGIGGGSACDTAKYISNHLNVPLVLIPSILSVDAAFTRAAGVRYVDKKSGKTSVRYVGDISATLKGLIIDHNLLKSAPNELNQAGIGDILSISTALWDWREASKRQGESFSRSIAEKSLSVLNKLIMEAESNIAECNDKGLSLLSRYVTLFFK